MNFWDRLGRLHTKPVTDDNPYPTNNAYIYSAYYKVLHPEQWETIAMMYLPSKMPFSRHPDATGPAISHDEITGVCILSKEIARLICEYLKSNHNQFCDLPGFVPKSLLKLNWLKVYKAFKALSKEANPRKATINYPDTWNLAFLQRPEYMWFYKRCAGINPSLFEKLYFIVARAYSVLTWKREEPNLLLFFCLKHLEQNNNLGIEGHLIQMYMNTYVDDMYNSVGHMLAFAEKDLPREYFAIHPWIVG